MVKLPRWLWVAAFLVCWPSILFAHPTLTAQNGDSLILYDTPCSDPDILAHIVAAGGGRYLEQFKQATLIYRGVTLKSCWLEKDGLVYSIDETGDRLQPLPKSSFRESSI